MIESHLLQILAALADDDRSAIFHSAENGEICSQSVTRVTAVDRALAHHIEVLLCTLKADKVQSISGIATQSSAEKTTHDS